MNFDIAGGGIHGTNVTEKFSAAHPVIYLSSDIMFKGHRTISDPYTIVS